MTRPTDPRHSGLRPAALDAGIFTVSLAILLVELLLTRIFSVVMYHHFSFLSVSLAMTGIGLGGLLVTLLPRAFRRDCPATMHAKWRSPSQRRSKG